MAAERARIGQAREAQESLLFAWQAEHAAQVKAWQARQLAYEQQKRWYAVRLPEGVHRLDIAGGTIAGWSALLHGRGEPAARGRRDHRARPDRERGRAGPRQLRPRQRDRPADLVLPGDLPRSTWTAASAGIPERSCCRRWRARPTSRALTATRRSTTPYSSGSSTCWWPGHDRQRGRRAAGPGGRPGRRRGRRADHGRQAARLTAWPAAIPTAGRSSSGLDPGIPAARLARRAPARRRAAAAAAQQAAHGRARPAGRYGRQPVLGTYLAAALAQPLHATPPGAASRHTLFVLGADKLPGDILDRLGDAWSRRRPASCWPTGTCQSPSGRGWAGVMPSPPSCGWPTPPMPGPRASSSGQATGSCSPSSADHRRFRHGHLRRNVRQYARGGRLACRLAASRRTIPR